MIKVIIERFIADTLEANYEQTAKEILQKAILSAGFSSGESLKDINNPRHRFIICNWRSVIDWQQWELSLERKEMMGKMNLMLEKEEKVTVLEIP
jgi:heme-degrading monooxygenase HmoA